MEKPIFANFRIPAYELPSRCPYSFPIKLSNFGVGAFEVPEAISQTSTKDIKKSISSARHKGTEISCQVDFQEDFVKLLEKEVLTEPTMQFLDVCDLDMPEVPSQTPNGYLKFPGSREDFLQVSEISLKAPIPRQKFVGRTGTIEVTLEEQQKMTVQARDPTAEFQQTHEYHVKVAREKLERLEEDALRLEQEMQLQNEDFYRLQADYEAETGKTRNQIGITYIERMEKNSKIDEENADDDERINKILTNNQDLYSRIQRALTPKTLENLDVLPVKEPLNPPSIKVNKFNPIISKRISAAMSTAAQVISTSKKALTPKVLKKSNK